MSEPYVTQDDIERQIFRLTGVLETATGELQTALLDHANADADYKAAYAQAFLNPKTAPSDERVTDKIREQRAVAETDELFRTRRITEARQVGLQEKCRQLRAQVDALRTLSANVRAQT